MLAFHPFLFWNFFFWLLQIQKKERKSQESPDGGQSRLIFHLESLAYVWHSWQHSLCFSSGKFWASCTSWFCGSSRKLIYRFLVWEWLHTWETDNFREVLSHSPVQSVTVWSSIFPKHVAPPHYKRSLSLFKEAYLSLVSFHPNSCWELCRIGILDPQCGAELHIPWLPHPCTQQPVGMPQV